MQKMLAVGLIASILIILIIMTLQPAHAKGLKVYLTVVLTY